jgi:hypothetical protein
LLKVFLRPGDAFSLGSNQHMKRYEVGFEETNAETRRPRSGSVHVAIEEGDRLTLATKVSRGNIGGFVARKNPQLFQSAFPKFGKVTARCQFRFLECLAI